MTSMEIDARCPQCNYAVDDASGVGETRHERPEVGDLAICIRCASLGIYIDNGDGTLGLRDVTVEEKVELSQRSDVMKVQQAIRKVSTPWYEEQESV